MREWGKEKNERRTEEMREGGKKGRKGVEVKKENREDNATCGKKNQKTQQ